MSTERRRIAVRTELVKEFLLDRLFDEVERTSPGELAPPVAAALDAALERLVEQPRGEALEEGAALAAAVARRGYLARLAETELFDAARAPSPWLGELLRGREAADVATDLALAEPPGKPEPHDEGATSWRIPGPGGHVRHYLALQTARHLLPRTVDGRRRYPEPLDETALKRCWLFGFYVRCCEEELAGGGSAGEAIGQP